MRELKQAIVAAIVDIMGAVRLRQMSDQGWMRVRFAHECRPCQDCEEPWCNHCERHYADCDCPGPNQDDLYEYTTVDGVLYAREFDTNRERESPCEH